MNDRESNTDIANPVSVQTELNLSGISLRAPFLVDCTKVGDRKYLENWSQDVAKIAERQISWIKNKLSDKKIPLV